MGQGEFRSSMAVQKGGRKGDGAAQDKETRANSQRSLLVPLCVPSQSWGMAEVGILDDEKVPESV